MLGSSEITVRRGEPAGREHDRYAAAVGAPVALTVAGWVHVTRTPFVSSISGGGLLAPALALVVDLANSDVEGQRVGLLRVVRPNTDVEHVEDRVGTFASELNWFGTRADEDALDLIGDVARPFDAFVSELSGRLSAQILAGHCRRLLVERVELARDLEDDVHATKASSR